MEGSIVKEQEQLLPHERVYTRLRPSRIHGVGVFAIQDIPENTKLFFDDLDEMVWVSKSQIDRLPSEQIKKLYEDFSPLRNDCYGCPRNFNRLTMAWYMNESAHPNVRCDTEYNFFTLREIKEGEELTVDYSTFSDPTG